MGAHVLAETFCVKRADGLDSRPCPGCVAHCGCSYAVLFVGREVAAHLENES